MIQPYKLVAELHGRTRTVEVFPDPNRPSTITEDDDVVLSATMEIISRAEEGKPGRDLWAYGRITLLNPDGEVIHTMEPKG